MTRGQGICLSALVPHCPSSSPLSKPFDSHSSRDILFLFGFGSFMLHSPPTMPSSGVCSIRPAARLSNGSYFLCLSYLWSLLLESLACTRGLIIYLFGRLHCLHPPYSSTPTAAFTAFRLLVSLVKLTLHGCLVPKTCHLLWAFLTRHTFSSWDFVSL